MEEDLDEEEDHYVSADTYANYKPAKCKYTVHIVCL